MRLQSLGTRLIAISFSGNDCKQHIHSITAKVTHHILAGCLLLTLPTERVLSQTPTTGQVPKLQMKNEHFTRDPGWIGVNNRSAQRHEPIWVRQDFGHSASTHNAGGQSAGEIGGFISPAGEVAFYGKPIESASLDAPLRASGTMSFGPGGTHLLLGFFNSDTVNEWRTPNTIVMRFNARGDRFFAYVEFCTSKWRAGGDTTPFPSITDPKTGRQNLIGFPCSKPFNWTLNYDPKANGGKGTVTATIGHDTAECNLDESHKKDGATFNHFGIMNVIKSAETGSEVWLDDIAVNGSAAETFAHEPNWSGRHNRRTTKSRLVRPWFDFGFSNTNFARGYGEGEIGGQIFRGDCRYVERMACYGDRVGPLTLDKPLKASGKVAMSRGVSDSTTLFGFYNSVDSMQRNESQSDSIPESVVGIHIEGPSSEGFRFYPVLRPKGRGSKFARDHGLSIYPNRMRHDWTMEYKPDSAGLSGRITVTLDETSVSIDMEAADKGHGTTLDRFGIVSSWIDGNSQDVYWDDLSYTISQE
jgi:hypothetical protein